MQKVLVAANTFLVFKTPNTFSTFDGRQKLKIEL